MAPGVPADAPAARLRAGMLGVQVDCVSAMRSPPAAAQAQSSCGWPGLLQACSGDCVWAAGAAAPQAMWRRFRLRLWSAEVWWWCSRGGAMWRKVKPRLE